MKIEKGKLYLYGGLLEKCMSDGVADDGFFSNKIAVHCPTKEDWIYLKIHEYDFDTKYFGNFFYSIIDGDLADEKWYKDQGFKTISIEEFKKFYPDPLQEAQDLIDNLPDGCIAKLGAGGSDLLITSERGKKESSNKLNYELDFDFITQMAERMQTNKGKYEPYNWKKPIEIEGLKQAIFRHVLEIMKGNYEDDGRLHGHLEALSCNAMMLNYQLKK